MSIVKDNIKQSINKLEIVQFRLGDSPTIEDVTDVIEIITDVLHTLEETKNIMSE